MYIETIIAISENKIYKIVFLFRVLVLKCHLTSDYLLKVVLTGRIIISSIFILFSDINYSKDNV